MVRNVIAVIIGLVVAFLVVLGIQSINFMLYPIPAGIDQSDMDQMTEYIGQLPVAAFVVVLMAHFFGAMAAAWVASMIADSHHRSISLGLAFFLLIMGLINVVQIPHPTWFIFADIFTYIPGGLLGFAIFNRKK